VLEAARNRLGDLHRREGALEGIGGDQDRASGLHRSNLYLWDWESLFRKRFKEIRLHRLTPPAGLDLSNPAPSKHSAEDFKVEEISPARPGDAGSLAAVFVGRGPRI